MKIFENKFQKYLKTLSLVFDYAAIYSEFAGSEIKTKLFKNAGKSATESLCYSSRFA